MLYLYLLHTHHEPDLPVLVKPIVPELVSHYAESFGCEVELLGWQMVQGPLPEGPDTYVVAASLLKLKDRGIEFDTDRDEISYSVDEWEGKRFGVCRIRVGAATAAARPV